MLPDSLYKDLPEKIALHAGAFLHDGEEVSAACPAKVGWSRMPALLLPGSCYVAVTDKRILGFLPTRGKALPGKLWFEEPLTSARRGTRHHQVVVATEGGKRRHLHLSSRFKQAADGVYTSVR
jgi:hypothetical protein